MKSLRELESVGWIFWLIVFILSLAPGLFASWAMTYDTTNMLMRVGFGIVLAMVGSGLIASGVNELLYRRTAKRYNARRKAERKQQKKKKKKGK